MKLSRYIKTIFLLVIFTSVFTIRAKATSLVNKSQQAEQIIKAQKPLDSENNSNQIPAEENKEEKRNEKETDDENESEVNGKHRQNTSELFVCYTILSDYLNFFSYSEKLNSLFCSCKPAGKELLPIYITIHNFRV